MIRIYKNIKSHLIFKLKSFLYSRVTPFKLSKKEILYYKKKKHALKKYFNIDFIGNLYYGNQFVLKKYARLHNKGMFNFNIEHGLYLHETVYEHETCKNVLTFSEFRKNVISKKAKTIDVFAIGPLIHYANDFYSNRSLKKIKSKLGSILLAFPVHSINGVNYQYDVDVFIKEINIIKSKFNIDTVIVNMFWSDFINKDYVNLYTSHNFQITCTGHRNDPLFLSRLKSLIKLSDYTMSNKVGTHLGYCILYNKPHYVFQQNIDINGELVESELSNRVEPEKHYKKITTAFASPVEKINPLQYSLVEYYWGFKNIHSKKELFQLLIN